MNTSSHTRIQIQNLNSKLGIPKVYILYTFITNSSLQRLICFNDIKWHKKHVNANKQSGKPPIWCEVNNKQS